ncbi:hypothetical protein [Leptobacterium sp. I13]|uniref:hypothetical protein n=1 Tax=Leptobacterium meishanense TaxID=3128904 RepID=UPI0030ECC565
MKTLKNIILIAILALGTTATISCSANTTEDDLYDTTATNGNKGDDPADID